MGVLKKTAEEEYRKYFCAHCGARLSSGETRVYLEGLYGIDPNGDARKLCKLCKTIDM